MQQSEIEAGRVGVYLWGKEIGTAERYMHKSEEGGHIYLNFVPNEQFKKWDLSEDSIAIGFITGLDGVWIKGNIFEVHKEAGSFSFNWGLGTDVYGLLGQLHDPNTRAWIYKKETGKEIKGD